ncbi:MAG: DUF460 domain-containing protein [Candidatus Micrarchaeia archaeon]|jgi:predicted RNase H-like nuclease (RuvC/YqgF family)
MYLIVGIDPGKTAAVACLDLEGRLICVSSKELAGIEWIVDTIRSYGTPILIGFDKKDSDKTIKKIAAIFGAQLYLPKSDISVERKKKMSENLSTANLHERDALVSALIAYNAYSNKFKQAERLAKEKNFSKVEEVKALVVKKYSISEAIAGKKSGRLKKLG